MADVTFEQFLEEAQACDVVVFHGESDPSIAVEVLTDGRFSHTAMVVIEPGTRNKFLWQAVSEELEPDLLHGGEKHAGAQLGRLAPTMLDVVRFRDTPTWRPFEYQRPNGFDDDVWQAIKPLDGRPFPGPWDLALNYAAGVTKHEVRNDGPMFCSQLVAYTMQQVGLLDRDRPANSVAPSDFSSDPRKWPVTPTVGQFLPHRLVVMPAPTPD